MLVSIFPVFGAEIQNGTSIYIEAEEFYDLDSHVFVENNLLASEGKCLTVVSGAPFGGVAGDTCGRYDFNLTFSAVYDVWFRVIAKDVGADSFFFGFDSSARREVYILNTGADWQWHKLTSAVNLDAGAHTLNFNFREPNFKLDRILITSNKGFVPVGTGELPHYVCENPEVSDNIANYSQPRPRLLASGAEIAAISGKAGTTHKPYSDRLKDSADYIATRTPPDYGVQYANNPDDLLWQREVGDHIITLAVAYKFFGTPSYLAGAIKFINAGCDYPTWGTVRHDCVDLEGGHMLFGMAVAYDWLYDDLSPQLKEKIKNTLLVRGQKMYEGSLIGGRSFWQQEYLQNHMWISMTGLNAAAVSLIDTDPIITEIVTPWLDRSFSLIKKTMEYLGDDGASHEGYGYWVYGVDWLFRYMDMARKFNNVNYYNVEWFEKTFEYGLYMTLPLNSWRSNSNRIDFADDPRGGWGRPAFIFFKLAAEYNNTNAQYFADLWHQKNTEGLNNAWQDILYFSDEVAKSSYTGLPLFKHFTDMDFIVSRSGWDGNESMLAFKCGPYIGHEAVMENDSNPVIDWGGGHVHPDVNNFVLFGNGQFLIRDDGYAQKLTSNHNTLLIDGAGQMGEGGDWFSATDLQASKARPEILKAEHTDDFDYIIGEGSAAYPADMGLLKFERHMIYLKPDILLVYDDIKTDEPRNLEIRFFPENENAVASNGGFLSAGSSARLRGEALTEPMVMEPVSYFGRYSQLNDRQAYRVIKNNADTFTSITAFSWSDLSSVPKKITAVKSMDDYIIDAAGQKYIINFSEGSVKKCIQLENKSIWASVFDVTYDENDVSVELKYLNDELNDSSYFVAVGQYDDENRLVDVKTFNDTMYAGINGSISHTVSKFGTRARTFLWKTSDNLIPMY